MRPKLKWREVAKPWPSEYWMAMSPWNWDEDIKPTCCCVQICKQERKKFINVKNASYVKACYDEKNEKYKVMSHTKEGHVSLCSFIPLLRIASVWRGVREVGVLLYSTKIKKEKEWYKLVAREVTPSNEFTRARFVCLSHSHHLISTSQ